MSLLKDRKEAVDALETMQKMQKSWEESCKKAFEELEMAQKKIAECKDALGDAADADDAVAFEAAKAASVGAEFTAEMAEMRLNRLKEKGWTNAAEIDSAIKSYESQIRAINAKACRSIFDQMTALIQTIDEANTEARQILKKERELCQLCGVKFNPVAGTLASERTIYAADVAARHNLRNILLDNTLRRFASYAGND